MIYEAFSPCELKHFRLCEDQTRFSRLILHWRGHCGRGTFLSFVFLGIQTFVMIPRICHHLGWCTQTKLMWNLCKLHRWKTTVKGILMISAFFPLQDKVCKIFFIGLVSTHSKGRAFGLSDFDKNATKLIHFVPSL